MHNNVININKTTNKTLRRLMVEWYIDNIKNANIARNPTKNKGLWTEVIDPRWPVLSPKGNMLKDQSLCNYVGRNYIDNLDAVDMQHIVNWVVNAVKASEYEPNVYIGDEHLNNLHTVMTNLQKGFYDQGFHKQHQRNNYMERWFLVMTMFEIIDQADQA